MENDLGLGVRHWIIVHSQGTISNDAFPIHKLQFGLHELVASRSNGKLRKFTEARFRARMSFE